MAIAIPCPACGEKADYDEAYAGCLRPCPRCGAKVQVPEDARRTVQAAPLDAVCFCGTRQVEPGAGAWCEVRFAERDQAIPPWLAWAGFVVLPMLGMLGRAKKLGMEAAQNPSRTEMEVRWVCPACVGQVRRARAWSLWGKWTLLAGGAAASICLISTQGTSPDDAMAGWGFAALAALGAYVAYRLGFLALCWGLARSYKGLKGVTLRADLRSPVYVHPDGHYEGSKA